MIRHLKKSFKAGLSVLTEPKKSFKELDKKTIEDVVSDYLILLLALSLFAGLASFIFSIIRAFYFNLFLNLEVNYLRLLNYSVGRSTSVIFFYLFAGTFIIFFVSAFLNLVVKIRYTELIKIILHSLYPLLFFSWIPMPFFPLTIWSLFLLYVGITSTQVHITKKDSIHRRV